MYPSLLLTVSYYLLDIDGIVLTQSTDSNNVRIAFTCRTFKKTISMSYCRWKFKLLVLILFVHSVCQPFSGERELLYLGQYTQKSISKIDTSIYFNK